MKLQPTYTANEILSMCLNSEFDFYSFKIFVALLEEELHLYDHDDLVIITNASMIIFTRTLLKTSLYAYIKNEKKVGRSL